MGGEAWAASLHPWSSGGTGQAASGLDFSAYKWLEQTVPGDPCLLGFKRWEQGEGMTTMMKVL